MKVLVVDDAPTNRRILKALLTRAGYAVIVAGSADEAREAFLRERPDAVLSDFHLADGEDGLSLATSLRAAADGAPLRLALMTGDASDDLRRAEAVDEVFSKPVQLKDLVAFIGAVKR